MNYLTSKLVSYLLPKEDTYAITVDFDCSENSIKYVAFHKLDPYTPVDEAKKTFIEENINNYKQMRVNLPDEAYGRMENTFYLYLADDDDQDLQNLKTMIESREPLRWMPRDLRHHNFIIYNFCEGTEPSGTAIYFREKRFSSSTVSSFIEGIAMQD